MKELIKLTELPQAFEKGTSDIWVDPDREEFILESHLDERIDGASKDEKFIEDTIQFIENLAPVGRYKAVIDLGCGPGLYSEKLAIKGYNVIGVDYAENSINYAISEAKKKNLQIEYRCDDFLNIEMSNDFDVALLIYQIYGLLKPEERKKLLENIYQGLKPGGLVLLDVLSDIGYDDFEDLQVWSRSRSDSPISQEKHLGLISQVKYPKKVTLQKSILIFPNGKLVNYNYWNQYFNITDLKKEANDVGLVLEDIYSDVNGEPYNEESEFIAVTLRKPSNL